MLCVRVLWVSRGCISGVFVAWCHFMHPKLAVSHQTPPSSPAMTSQGRWVFFTRQEARYTCISVIFSICILSKSLWYNQPILCFTHVTTSPHILWWWALNGIFTIYSRRANLGVTSPISVAGPTQRVREYINKLGCLKKVWIDMFIMTDTSEIFCTSVTYVVSIPKDFYLNTQFYTPSSPLSPTHVVGYSSQFNAWVMFEDTWHVWH